MKKLTKEKILSVIKQKNDERMSDLVKSLNKAVRKKESSDIQFYSERISTFKNSSLALKYFTRLNVFKCSNLVFNPETMEAFSYRWYSIAKVINGKMILNSYHYSVTTSKQVWVLRSLFQELGIKYESVEAPKGLQDLDRALLKHNYLLAGSIVNNKYARKKTNAEINYQKSRIKLLKSLGAKCNEDALNCYIETHEEIRFKRLAGDRFKRDQKKQVANIVETPKLQLISGGAA